MRADLAGVLLCICVLLLASLERRSQRVAFFGTVMGRSGVEVRHGSAVKRRSGAEFSSGFLFLSEGDFNSKASGAR